MANWNERIQKVMEARNASRAPKFDSLIEKIVELFEETSDLVELQVAFHIKQKELVFDKIFYNPEDENCETLYETDGSICNLYTFTTEDEFKNYFNSLIAYINLHTPFKVRHSYNDYGDGIIYDIWLSLPL